MKYQKSAFETGAVRTLPNKMKYNYERPMISCLFSGMKKAKKDRCTNFQKTCQLFNCMASFLEMCNGLYSSFLIKMDFSVPPLIWNFVCENYALFYLTHPVWQVNILNRTAAVRILPEKMYKNDQLFLFWFCMRVGICNHIDKNKFWDKNFVTQIQTGAIF